MEYDWGQLTGYSSLLVLVLGPWTLFLFSRSGKGKTSSQDLTLEKTSSPQKSPGPAQSFTQRVFSGFKISREKIWGRLGQLMAQGNLSPEQQEEIEELLYSADVGPTLVEEMLQVLKKDAGETSPLEVLRQYIADKINPIQERFDPHFYEKQSSQTLKTIMITGVNGVGKTTSLGKLAAHLSKQGARVVVGACDTFRAAAIPQLQTWCERAGAELVFGKEGSDPSGVAYRALEKAQNTQADYCLIDTAGRLHTEKNLMEELQKSQRVLQKLDPSAPQKALLVIDAITGQNALRQAQEFHSALGLDGIILTKCDGHAKAGTALGLLQQLQIPIEFIGVGEGVEDLGLFKAQDYINALLG